VSTSTVFASLTVISPTPKGAIAINSIAPREAEVQLSASPQVTQSMNRGLGA
jgi:hypothetical protein